MDRTLFSRASRFFLGTTLAAAALFLAGCDLTVTNLTPATLPENPSQLYTLTTRIEPKSKAIAPGSIKPIVVIDGKSHEMRPSEAGGNLWEYDYRLPAGRNGFAYYVLVSYRTEAEAGYNAKQAYTELEHVQVERRYVVSLEVSRGPVGARIGVLGRGFGPADIVYFGDVPARTVFDSPTSISFYVPNVAAGRNYDVSLSGASGVTPIGTFRVDGVDLTLSPESLALTPGGTQNLTFTLATAAPPGGLLLDITTDAPDSVIMPEVVVPAGQTSVTVPVQGGQPGTGSLFLKGFGPGGELIVPFSVQ